MPQPRGPPGPPSTGEAPKEALPVEAPQRVSLLPQMRYGKNVVPAPEGTLRAPLGALSSTRFPPVRVVAIDDGELRIEDRPDPQPGSHELLVRIRAAGINGADMHQRRGRYPAPPGSPQDIPGLELAGEVAALGPGAERFAVGERVMAIVGGGGQAELAVLHERAAMPVPEGLDWPQAGGLPEVFVTAHDALFTQADLRPGEPLLVHRGGGGRRYAAVPRRRAPGARGPGHVPS